MFSLIVNFSLITKSSVSSNFCCECAQKYACEKKFFSSITEYKYQIEATNV